MRGVFAYVDHSNPKPVDWVSCTFFLCHRKLMAEVGFFDDRYFLYYEDIDLSERIRKKGKDIYYYPEIEIIHYQKWPSIIDFGGSPYIYFNKHFGLHVAKNLRYILIFKTFLRLLIFFPFVFLPGRIVLGDKFKSYYRTFKFHLFDASEIIRSLSIPGKRRPKLFIKI
jgi:GT2 family glycosyltransferase